MGVYHPDGGMNMDAGAFSMVVWMRAINETLKEQLPVDELEEDLRHKLQALLISQRITPFQFKEDIQHMHENLTDIEYETEVEEENVKTNEQTND